MEREIEKRTIREMLQLIEKRPGMYLGEKDSRIDYLYHFLTGWFGNNDDEVNSRYRAGIANWIYDFIVRTKSEEVSDIEFSFLWYKMIYGITNSEKEAWDLFFKLSYEYLDYLEKEN